MNLDQMFEKVFVHKIMKIVFINSLKVNFLIFFLFNLKKVPLIFNIGHIFLIIVNFLFFSLF